MKRHAHPTVHAGSGPRTEATPIALDALPLFRFHLAVLRKSIRDHRLVHVTIPDRPDVSMCIPFDYIPSGPLESDGSFVFYPVTSDGRIQDRLEVNTRRLLRLNWTDRLFDPSEFIGWPSRWHIPRDWPVRRPVRRQSDRISGS